MSVKADDTGVLTHGKKDNADRRDLCRQICLLLFRGSVLRADRSDIASAEAGAIFCALSYVNTA